MATTIDDEKKRKIPTLAQAMFGGGEPMPSVQPQSRNYAEMASRQPPVAQSIGEGIGKAAGAVSGAAGKIGEFVGGVARKAYTTPIPSTAPLIANQASQLIAGIQSGATGQKYTPQQFEAKSIGQGVNTIANLATKYQPQVAAPKVAQNNATQNAGVVPNVGISAPPPPVVDRPPMQQPSNPVLDGLGIQNQTGYKKLTGGIYDTGNADIYGRSNRADGKLNDFAGAGVVGRLNWEQRPENAQAVALAKQNAGATLTSPALIAARNAAAARGDYEGAISSINQELNAGKPLDQRASLNKMLVDLQKMPLDTGDQKSRYKLKLAEYEKAAQAIEGIDRNDITRRGQDITGDIQKDRLDLDEGSPERGIAALQYQLQQDLVSGDPKKVAAAQAKMKALGLGAKAKDNVISGSRKIYNEFGQITGEEPYLLDATTGQPIGVAAAPTVTREQVDAAAKAKGITDPKQLQQLYLTYGVQ